MLHHPNPEAVTHALLDLLVRERASLWSVDALNRALYPPDAPGSTDDAIADLYAAGLVHRVGDFVFASRAAVEAERINA
jgi:hypothetical protein